MIKNGLKLIAKTAVSLRTDGYRITIAKIANKLAGNVCVAPANTQTAVEPDSGNGFFSLYQENEIFTDMPKVKALAFYLPQYHQFPENDFFWEKGFTEWTNTRKSAPRYRGHYQPREPHADIGYYDLSRIESLKKQAELAKQHGIYGFCMYYYWFSGKRLMEKPIDLLLEHPEIDIRFCLCWANESWTRTWDGLKNDILIEQKYAEEDTEKFINDIGKYINDNRYITYKGKPVIVVYNPGDIPNVKTVFTKWKETAKKTGIGDISIWICQSFENDITALQLDDLVEKEIEFPPHKIGTLPIANTNPAVSISDSHVFDYSKMVDVIRSRRATETASQKLFRTVMLGWDNSARRNSGFSSFDNFNIGKYYQWLRMNVDEAVDKHDTEDRYVFINAWNEWAEGTYLEPDKKYGYSYINVTSRAIMQKDFTLETVVRKSKNRARIAVQAHIFYVDLADEVISYINHIPEAYDLFITTDSVTKAYELIALTDTYSNANQIIVTVYDNKGRDVGPFIMQMQNKALAYDYLCHIHTKKSMHSNTGEKWRIYLYSNLLGTGLGIQHIINRFDCEKNLGIVYPETYKPISPAIKWGSNKQFAEELFSKLETKVNISNDLYFPAGNMMWLRPQAVHQMFDNKLKWEDFPQEINQLDGTIMHAIERSWVFLAKNNGYTHEIINTSAINNE